MACGFVEAVLPLILCMIEVQASWAKKSTSQFRAWSICWIFTSSYCLQSFDAYTYHGTKPLLHIFHLPLTCSHTSWESPRTSSYWMRCSWAFYSLKISAEFSAWLKVLIGEDLLYQYTSLLCEVSFTPILAAFVEGLYAPSNYNIQDDTSLKPKCRHPRFPCSPR